MDPLTAGAHDFLARLLTEQTRLTRALDTVGSLIGVYEKLAEGEAVHAPAVAVAPIQKPTAVPPAREPDTSDTRLFTPERNAIIRRDYPLGVSTEEIRRRLHALPGREVRRDRIAIQAHKLGVGRPTGAACDRPPAEPLSQPLASVPALTFPSPVPTPSKPTAPQPKSRMEALAMVSRSISPQPAFDPGDPVAADFNQVGHWAGQRGLQFSTWDDLPAVNRKREALSLPPFKRSFPMRGRFG
jgi:hypothetical protein